MFSVQFGESGIHQCVPKQDREHFPHNKGSLMSHSDGAPARIAITTSFGCSRDSYERTVQYALVFGGDPCGQYGSEGHPCYF